MDWPSDETWNSFHMRITIIHSRAMGSFAAPAVGIDGRTMNVDIE